MENILNGYFKDMDNLESGEGVKNFELNFLEKLSLGICISILKVV